MDLDSHDDVLEELLARTPVSRAAYEKGCDRIPAGVVSRGRLYPPYPFVVREAHGCHLIDLDGNEYLDCATSYGAAVLGHTRPEVVEAVQEAVTRGQNVCMPHQGTYRLAELVLEAVPGAERVTFCNSGTEATLHAIRIARACTGKPGIAKFEGGYHGDHDYVLGSAFAHSLDELGPLTHPHTVPDSIGIPAATLAHTHTLPFNHPATLDTIRHLKDSLAVVLVEGVQGAGGCIPVDTGFLRELREVTRLAGVLLLMDEVFTGFRLALGGAQEYFGVVPDLATYGKALGGGLPVAGVAGSAAVMDTINYTGRHDEDSQSKAHYGGTMNGNVVAMAAGCAALEYLTRHREQVYPYLNRQGERIREAINHHCRGQGIPAQAIGAGSIFYTHFMTEPIRRSRDLLQIHQAAQRRFFLHLLRRGVFIPFMHLGMISAAHEPEDVERVIEAHCQALDAVHAEMLHQYI